MEVKICSLGSKTDVPTWVGMRAAVTYGEGGRLANSHQASVRFCSPYLHLFVLCVGLSAVGQ